MITQPGYALKLAVAVALLLALAVPSAQAGAKRLYLNSYGSGWGLWVRGTCLLEQRDDRLILELEELTLEPNHNYPQAFEIAGFRLASVRLDAATGDRASEPPATGPQAEHPKSLAPGKKTLVEGLRLELPVGQPPASREVRLLLLQVVVLSGAAFEIEVTPLRGS